MQEIKDRRKKILLTKGEQLLNRKRVAAELKRAETRQEEALHRFVSRLETGSTIQEAMQQLGFNAPEVDSTEPDKIKANRRVSKKLARTFGKEKKIKSILDTEAMGNLEQEVKRVGSQVQEELRDMNTIISEKTPIKEKLSLLEKYDLKSTEQAKLLKAAVSEREGIENNFLQGNKIRKTIPAVFSVTSNMYGRDADLAGMPLYGISSHPVFLAVTAEVLLQFAQGEALTADEIFANSVGFTNLRQLFAHSKIRSCVINGMINLTNQKFNVIDGTRDTFSLMPVKDEDPAAQSYDYIQWHDGESYYVGAGGVPGQYYALKYQVRQNRQTTATAVEESFNLAPMTANTRETVRADWNVNYTRVNSLYYNKQLPTELRTKEIWSTVISPSTGSWCYTEVTNSTINNITFIVDLDLELFSEGPALLRSISEKFPSFRIMPDVVYFTPYSDCTYIVPNRVHLMYLGARESYLRTVCKFCKQLTDMYLYLAKNNATIPKTTGSKRALLKRLIPLFKIGRELRMGYPEQFMTFLIGCVDVNIPIPNVTQWMTYFAKPKPALFYYLAEATINNVALYSPNELLDAIREFGNFFPSNNIGLPIVLPSDETIENIASVFTNLLKREYRARITVNGKVFLDNIKMTMTELNREIQRDDAQLGIERLKVRNYRDTLAGVTDPTEKIRLLGFIDGLNVGMDNIVKLQDDRKTRLSLLNDILEKIPGAQQDELFTLAKKYDSLGGIFSKDLLGLADVGYVNLEDLETELTMNNVEGGDGGEAEVNNRMMEENFIQPENNLNFNNVRNVNQNVAG